MAAFHSHHLPPKKDNVQTDDNAKLEETKWWKDTPRIKYKGFLLKPDFARACQFMEEQFNPLPTDIILASFPKTGTTWLKALTISIINNHKISKLHSIGPYDPLSTHNPHELVPFLEMETFGENPSIKINQMPSPRVFNTHLAYSILPEQIKKSTCKIVYISRNPWDTFVSLWHFFNMNFGVQATLEEAIDDFCKGLVPCDPYFEHVLEFWQVKEKTNIFFITYEELKQNRHQHVKELAEFLNFPLNNSEEVEQVIANCSIEKLKKVEANRDESSKFHWTGYKFDSFYRKGVVGDWKNHMSQETAQRINEIGKQKWDGTGLELKLFCGHNYE